MTDIVGRSLTVLFDASLAATAISGLVVLVMVQCRQPARRLGWARAGLLASLTLIPMAALNPVPPVDVGRLIQVVVPSKWDDPVPLCGRPRPRDAYLPDLDGVHSPDPGAGRPVGHLVWPRRLALGLLLIYGAGVASGLARLVLGLWGMTVLVRRGRPPTQATLAVYASLSFAPFRSRPRIVVSDRMTRPALAGFFGPIILLPPESEDPDAEWGLRLSLLHELAHAESGDHIVTPWANLVQSIWFFLPPIWWIRDQMKMDQEFLADRRAVGQFGNSGGYASSLVDLAGSGRPAARADDDPRSVASQGSGVWAASGKASSLIQRVTMLLKCPFAIENHPPLWWRRSAAATITLATLAASCLSFRGLAPTSAEGDEVMRPARSFRIASLAIAPSGNERPFDLRFRLPPSFTLNLEIMADPDDLPGIEILQHRLGSTDARVAPMPVYRLWHKVLIRRREGRDEVEVDGRPIARSGEAGRPATWLTIRAISGRTTRIRDLAIAW